MRELSLFTGAGGGLLGSMLLGWRLTAAVEWDAYCQRVLCARGGYMADAGCDGSELDARPGVVPSSTGAVQGEARQRQRGGHGAGPDREGFPVYSDVRDFHPVPGSCDIVTGGFPCQPFSQAGKRLGEDDPRNMWPSALRILVESEAPLGFFENVPGLLSSGYFGTVLGDLAEAGFDAEWCVLGADDVGAPHRRKRLWILAYRKDEFRRRLDDDGQRSRGDGDERPRLQEQPRGSGRHPIGADYGHSPWRIDPADVGHADDAGPQGHGDDGERAGERAAGTAGAESPWAIDPADWCPINERVCEWVSRCDIASRVSPYPDGTGEWESFTPLGRVSSGVGSRVDRLRALGNGQVPHTMAAAWTILAHAAGILI